MTPLSNRSVAQQLTEGMKVVPLTGLVKVAIPALYISSLPKNAIGFSFERGRFGVAVGAFLFTASMLIALILSREIGIFAFPVAFWLIGDTSLLMIYNGTANRIAFVKTFCSGCRLRPIIEEHEAIHLAGVENDRAVWSEMKKRYSFESLALEGDPTICTFCPIAKRLREN